ncbi:MAG: DUF86 domain-containing protein [Alphaproteobacteria bacterium]|nr:DUF86 domain-containing protein [Alphaproteobacteria bacterium]
MLDYARLAVEYGTGHTPDQLEADVLRYLAVQRALEVIGEAASQVPEGVRTELAAIPFRKAIAMRNKIIHGYGTVDAEVVVDTISNSLPQLISQLEVALSDTLPDER